jgi:hypothetical protein
MTSYKKVLKREEKYLYRPHRQLTQSCSFLLLLIGNYIFKYGLRKRLSLKINLHYQKIINTDNTHNLFIYFEANFRKFLYYSYYLQKRYINNF